MSLPTAEAPRRSSLLTTETPRRSRDGVDVGEPTMNSFSLLPVEAPRGPGKVFEPHRLKAPPPHPLNRMRDVTGASGILLARGEEMQRKRTPPLDALRWPRDGACFPSDDRDCEQDL